MNNNYHENLCPRCLVGRMKTWQKLTDDEKILAEKMPLSAQYSLNERKRHSFCTRCWFEQTSQKVDV